MQCKKHGSSSNGRTRVKTASSNIGVISYKYDNEGRITELQGNTGSSQVFTFSYTAGQVTSYYVNSNGNNTTYDTITYMLDANGYISKENRKSTPNATTFWGCNADGRLLFSARNQGGNIHRTEYFYNAQSGLLDSTVEKDNSVWSATTTILSYEMDKPYSLSNKNFGQGFSGEKFIHPPKSGITKTRTNNSIATVTFNFTYQYDDQNRIIQSTESQSGGSTATINYTYY
jgi:hypothetical protein